MPFHLPVSSARALAACLVLAIFLGACQPAAGVNPSPGEATTSTASANQALAIQSSTERAEPGAQALPTLTETALPQAVEPSPSPNPSQTPQPAPALFLPAYLPAGLRESLRLPESRATSTDPQNTALTLDVLPASAGAGQAVEWVYALVAPFPTLADDISLRELRAAWRGTAKEAPFASLLVEPGTRALLEKHWGPAGKLVKSAPASQLAEQAWQAGAAWSIVPFEQLEPRWKVIAIDGQSPVRKDFDAARYGLSLRFGLRGDAQARAGLDLAEWGLRTNRDPARLTTVMLTGVTALVRGTASLMEGRGLNYPATDIGDWLREADILHINNEVPFAENCPPPFNWPDLVFCSRPKYIELLREVGTDVIELSGDHFADWGPEAMLYTLELYKQEGWPYYGGGANLEEARQPALFDHNGNKIAFIGCNAKEPGYATASDTSPGAGHCDFERLVADIKALRARGYLPVVTFQHLEYYQYIALPYLQEDFQRVADAGAVIVSGSQAHQPHAFEFRPGAFLHYGLGNLFFDQTNQGEPPRTAFIDRHVIYDGRHISTELLTIYLVDYARSRPMTLPEREALLEVVFKASGWDIIRPEQ